MNAAFGDRNRSYEECTDSLSAYKQVTLTALVIPLNIGPLDKNRITFDLIAYIFSGGVNAAAQFVRLNQFSQFNQFHCLAIALVNSIWRL